MIEPKGLSYLMDFDNLVEWRVEGTEVDLERVDSISLGTNIYW
jgi:hypothetical protein